MPLSFAAFAFILLLLLVVASAPIWPWSRGIGPRPMLVSALCLTLAVLAAVWFA